MEIVEKVQKLDMRILQNPELIADYVKAEKWNRGCKGKKAIVTSLGKYGIHFTFETSESYQQKFYSLDILTEKNLNIYEEVGIMDERQRRASKIRMEMQSIEQKPLIFKMEIPSIDGIDMSFQDGEYTTAFHNDHISLRQINQAIQSTTQKDVSLFLSKLNLYLQQAYHQNRIPVDFQTIREEEVLMSEELEAMEKEEQMKALIRRAPIELQTSKILRTDAYRFLAGSNNHACTFATDIEGLSFWFETETGWERRQYKRNGVFSYIVNETYQEGQYYVTITSAMRKQKNAQFHARYEIWEDGSIETTLSAKIVEPDGEMHSSSMFPFGVFHFPNHEKAPYEFARKHLAVVLRHFKGLTSVFAQEIVILEKIYFAFLKEQGLLKEKGSQTLEKASF